MKINTPIDFSSYNTVFCDSTKALEWAYSNGLAKDAIIKSSAPAMLWKNKKNIHNIEDRWSTYELDKFQSTIHSFSKNIFNEALNISGVEREIALVVSLSAYLFQKIIYKASCLNEDDFTDPRIFIYVDGKNGPAGNMMNSPWDKLLSHNPSFLTVNYTLSNDEWKTLNTHGISYWRRFKVAGFETIIYRLAIKLTKHLPNSIFKKELLLPNENELNIEIAYFLSLHGIKISKIQLKSLSNVRNKAPYKNTEKIYKAVSLIMSERVKEWVTPSAVDITMGLFKSYLEGQLNNFSILVDEWEKIIANKSIAKKVVLANAPGSINGRALAYACRKNNIKFMSSQHGVSKEISKMHSILPGVDNSVADVMFSYNFKSSYIEESTYYNKSKHYVVGMPLRLINMKHLKTIKNPAFPIVYISTNLYHMGFSLAGKTDYTKAVDEYKLVTEVFSALPHKVCYKSYPEDNRRYADIDPVLMSAYEANNINVFTDKVDMRYLISRYSVFVTTCATSTLGWPVMSGKPVVFINQNNNLPLTSDAYESMSKGLFVFDDNDPNFYKQLKEFLSQPISEIKRLWLEKEKHHNKMIKDYFSEHKDGAGKRAAKIILKEYLN